MSDEHHDFNIRESETVAMLSDNGKTNNNNNTVNTISSFFEYTNNDDGINHTSGRTRKWRWFKYIAMALLLVGAIARQPYRFLKQSLQSPTADASSDSALAPTEPDSDDGAHDCFDRYEDETAACHHPTDINPLGSKTSCTKLPDCPYWCNADDYCNDGTLLIKGEDIPKYETELFLLPVLVNGQNNTRHNIAAREFLQQILPKCTYPQTRVWGYGDPDFWESEDEPVSFHNPAASVEALANRELKMTFFNDLVQDPVQCRCSTNPNNNDCKPLSHVLQDCAGVPLVDTRLHWANPGGPNGGVGGGKAVCSDGTKRTDCTGKYSYVYDGPIPNVAHLHGAHADPESDGYTEAWFLPKLSASDQNTYATGGNFYKTFRAALDPTDICAEGSDAGLDTNTYRNDKSSATLFFHDHTLGMTRLNVMAIGVGFYFIRDENCVSNRAGLSWYGETGLDCTKYTLPGPPPTAELYNNNSRHVKPPSVEEIVRELPIAIQDMSFYLDLNKNETRQFYPADHDHFLDEEMVLNNEADRWGCNHLNGNDAYHNHKDDQGEALPVPPIWNPEVFFDVAVVNGRAWPEHQVSPNRYRLRLLNACDSRTLSLSAWAVPFGTDVENFNDLFDRGTELPIWIIGTEQSLLPDGPAKILSTTDSKRGTIGSVTKYVCGDVDYEDSTESHRGILMQPGERYDALIDFADFGHTEVYLVNTGPDEPFKTFKLIDEGNRAPFDTLGQIMKFNVSLEGDIDDVASPPDQLCFDSNPGGVAALSQVDTYRSVYLKEEVTVDPDLGPYTAALDDIFGNPEEGKGWAKPITENVQLNHVEEWDVMNLSADSHPIHLHQVKFQIVKRCLTNATCAEGDGVLGYERGWKDVAIAYPNVDGEGEPVVNDEDEPIGFTTTIRMKFDILGLYVWHCHILSHEDNEMMRPLCVYDPMNNSTLNLCCPGDLVYNEPLWNEENKIQCVPQVSGTTL